MKLNLGCGNNKLPGFVNVDYFKECEPDVLHNLDTLPWPWADNSVDEIRMIHSLEHIGADSQTFLGIMKEIYRICKNGSTLIIHVPHPRHDNFIGDPTHVRIITPQLLSLFSKKLNLEWKRLGGANSPLALYLGVDFELIETREILDAQYAEPFNKGLLPESDIRTMMRNFNNVVAEYHMTLRVNK